MAVSTGKKKRVRMKGFVDQICVDEDEYVNDLRMKLVNALEKMSNGEVGSIRLGSTNGRDSYLELERIGDLYLISGSEDSVERGTYVFSVFRSDAPDDFLETSEGTFPLYATLESFPHVCEIALKYFATGDVPRNIRWLVLSEGFGLSKRMIRTDSIIEVGDMRPLEVLVNCRE